MTVIYELHSRISFSRGCLGVMFILAGNKWHVGMFAHFAGVNVSYGAFAVLPERAPHNIDPFHADSLEIYLNTITMFNTDSKVSQIYLLLTILKITYSEFLFFRCCEIMSISLNCQYLEKISPMLFTLECKYYKSNI
jgi:hypothetical protein